MVKVEEKIVTVDDLMKGAFIDCVGVSSPASVEVYISAFYHTHTCVGELAGIGIPLRYTHSDKKIIGIHSESRCVIFLFLYSFTSC